MSDKISFIAELLNSKKIVASHKERLLLLTANEYKSSTEKIFLEIEGIKQKMGFTIIDDAKEIEVNKARIHNPKKITNFLKNFRENTNLKFSTHIWDNDKTKYPSIEEFIKGLDSDKKIFKFEELFNHNIDLYNLIKYFLFDPKKGIIDGIPKYGWPNLYEIKIGWQFPDNLLINWCKENYDNKEENQPFKFPMEFPLPKHLKPKTKINGKFINSFEDVVTLFKNEIEFRNNNLFDEISKKKASILNDYEINSFDNLKNFQFYTYTRGILISISRIFELFKKNETAKKILIEYELIENVFILNITQIDSFPTKQIQKDNLSNFVGGDLNYIIENIFSLCDYSIISKFKDINGTIFNGKIDILYDNVKAEVEKSKIKKILTKPIFQETTNNVKGFTHQFKFYI